MDRFKAGDLVKSSPYYVTQFPAHIKANRGKPFRGRIKKVQPDGRLIVKWIQQAQTMTLHPRFFEIDSLE